jgi:hypothetical protein
MCGYLSLLFFFRTLGVAFTLGDWFIAPSKTEDLTAGGAAEKETFGCELVACLLTSRWDCFR